MNPLLPGLIKAAEWHEWRAAQDDALCEKEMVAGGSGKISALRANEHKMAAAYFRALAGAPQDRRMP